MPGLLAAILVAGGVAGRAFEEPDTASDSDAVIHSVVVTPVMLQSAYSTERSYVGRVEARRRSRLSFELDGLVEAVHFDEGDHVVAGVAIAELDTDLLRTRRAATAARLAASRATLDELVTGPRAEAIAAAKASVRAFEARWEVADQRRRRTEVLVRDGTITPQAHDDTRFAAAAAAGELASARERLLELENGTRTERLEAQRATVAELEAELATIDVRIEKSTLRSPYAGTIAGRFVDEGAVVAAGNPILDILETDHLEVRIGVPGDVVRQLDRTATHEIVIEGIAHRGALRSTRPDRDESTRTVSALFALSKPTERIHVGDLAELVVRRQVEKRGFWAPVSSLTESRRGLWACYVASPGPDAAHYVLERRELEVLYQTATQAFVRGSLADGDLVVTAGIHRLAPGQRVRLADVDGEAR